MTVHEYIRKNWVNTIRLPDNEYAKSNFRLPKPYTTPCATSLFVNFFYWDTYFTNIGLTLDGMKNQVENNLDVMKFFIDFLGYIPNADHLIMRSQPPLFTRAVYDYYKATEDKAVIEKYIDAALRELCFFENDRMTPCGLNRYGTFETNTGKLWYYDNFDQRLGGYTEAERKIDPCVMAENLLAIAESGWDFNPRFQKPENRFAANDFAHLDLNCILYDAEQKAAEMLKIIGRTDKMAELCNKAKNRKELIDHYMLDPETGIYYDYDYVSGKRSTMISAAAFYPYALGISDNGEACKTVLEKLDLPFGLSTCEYRGEDTYFQWDYPNMWPSNVYFAYLALKNTGSKDEAENLRKKYMTTVETVFEATGELWEKYDALQGEVSVTCEYQTPEMMGWTAGVYEYLYFCQA